MKLYVSGTNMTVTSETDHEKKMVNRLANSLIPEGSFAVLEMVDLSNPDGHNKLRLRLVPPGEAVTRVKCEIVREIDKKRVKLIEVVDKQQLAKPHPSKALSEQGELKSYSNLKELEFD